VWNKDASRLAFTFLVMLVFAMLATALLALGYVFKFLETSLTAQRLRRRRRPANQA
jgi:hypothetical protein